MDVPNVVRGAPRGGQDIAALRELAQRRQFIVPQLQQNVPCTLLPHHTVHNCALCEHNEEIKQNKLKYEKDKKREEEDLLNRPSTSNYISPFTPFEPSRMHVNDMPDDCLMLLLEQFESLQELVEKAFVCPRWVQVLKQALRTRQHSLKVFDFDRNIPIYQECALMQYNLQRLNVHAGVKQTGDKQEDHLFIRSFNGQKSEYIMHVLMELFSSVQSLVLQTLALDHAVLIQSMAALTSVTLIELPDSRKHQNRIWEAFNGLASLRAVHIFYLNGDEPFVVDKMDFLTKIEAFTLDNYEPKNLNAVLNRLGPQLRCLQIGPFERGDKVINKLIAENPQMVANLTQLSVRQDEKSMKSLMKPYVECYHPHKKLLKLITTHFKALTYLDLEFASLLLYFDIMQGLSELTNLTELRFTIRASGSYVLWRAQPNGVDRRQVRQLPNIKTVYLTKLNNVCNDSSFISSLFPKATAPTNRPQANANRIHLEDIAELHNRYRMHNIRVAPPNEGSNLFPGLEQAIFVLNTNKPGWGTYSQTTFRSSIRNCVPPQAWHRLRLFNASVGTLNETFFGGDAADLAAHQHLQEHLYGNNNRNDHHHHHEAMNDFIEYDHFEDTDDDDDDDDGDDGDILDRGAIFINVQNRVAQIPRLHVRQRLNLAFNNHRRQFDEVIRVAAEQLNNEAPPHQRQPQAPRRNLNGMQFYVYPRGGNGQFERQPE